MSRMPVELIDIGPLDRRRRCECCQFPTLIVPDKYEPNPWWDSTPTSCPLCEWDSQPLDVDGELRAAGESDEDRNDGLSLEAARHNFARFLSIYDPGAPPIWKPTPTSPDVVERRGALRSAYSRLSGRDAPDAIERWQEVLVCEQALALALAAQQAADQALDEDAN